MKATAEQKAENPARGRASQGRDQRDKRGELRAEKHTTGEARGAAPASAWKGQTEDESSKGDWVKEPRATVGGGGREGTANRPTTLSGPAQPPASQGQLSPVIKMARS